jgi:hypothetical protein
MSDEGSAPKSGEHKVWVEDDRGHGVDLHQQYRVVTYGAIAAAVPFIVAHFLIGTFAFPCFSQLFGTMPGPLPWPSAVLLSVGWLAAPLLAIIDIATFWIIYRITERWRIRLLFLPVLVYGMMSAFLGFLLYIPLFPLITLVT